jgi:hypothetical protein
VVQAVDCALFCGNEGPVAVGGEAVGLGGFNEEARCCEAALHFPDFDEGLGVCGVFEAWVVVEAEE